MKVMDAYEREQEIDKLLGPRKPAPEYKHTAPSEIWRENVCPVASYDFMWEVFYA